MQTEIRKLCIIAGSGSFPVTITNYCVQENIPYLVLLIENYGKSEDFSPTNIIQIKLGEVGKALAIMEEQKISHVIFAGSIKRPNIFKLKLDKIGKVLLAQIAKEKILGDDSLLTIVIKFIENYKFKVIDIKDIMGDKLLAKNGIIGNIAPDQGDLEDIESGASVIKMLGSLDIGQALIIENRYILAVEAAEGTDELIRRTKSLKKDAERSAVLIKAAKPKQSTKIDLPTIGPKTIELAHESGLSGIAISSGSTIILEKESTIKLANEFGIFIYGF